MPGLGNRPGGDGLRPSQRPSSPQDRRDNLQDRLASREDFRDQNREDWQDRRDEVREDWQDRYDDFYDRHEDWHHGCGDYGDWWDHMWDDHTALMAFGVTMWGLNWAGYGFGYWGYENPYYTESYPVGGDVVIDYSQPMVVESAEASGSAVPTEAAASAAPGMSDFDAARQSFYQGDYESALASTNKALSALPNDPIVHEFRALVLFAQGKYQEAAAGLYSVLTVGPGWDWTTLSSLYPDVETYTKHLRALEAVVKKNPLAFDARFVLAYHYLTTGNKSAAANQFKRIYAQRPDDRLVKELLLMTGGAEAAGIEPAAVPSAPSEAPAVPATDLVGKWTATGEGKSTFRMDLTKEGNFSWTYTRGGKSEEVKGVYAVDGNVLAMEPESGGQMLAEVTRPQSGSFQFTLLGAPPGDPGLKFAAAR